MDLSDLSQAFISLRLRQLSKKWHCCVEVTVAGIYGWLFLFRWIIDL